MSVLLTAYNKSIATELQNRVPGAFGTRAFEPNNQQRAIIEAVSNSDNHLIVQARAGTGKTATLMLLLPYIADGPRDVTVSTIHSYGFSCWKRAFPLRRIQVDADKVRKIIDSFASWEEEVEDPETEATVKTTRVDTDYTYNWVFFRKLVSLAKLAGFGTTGAPPINEPEGWQELIDYHDLADDIKEEGTAPEVMITKAVCVLTESNNQGRTVVDFDDMTYLPLLKNVKLQQYDYVLNDEIQDQSHVRRMLAYGALRPGTGRMIGVGDRSQAVYAFSGASCNSMDLMKDMLTQSDKEVTELPLTVTYRCCKSVVREAQYIVPDIEARADAVEGIVRSIPLTQFWSCGPFGETDAILCRNTKPLVSLAYEFLSRRIPAIIEGKEIGAGLIHFAQHWKLVTLSQLSDRLNKYRESKVTKYILKKMEYKAAEVGDRCDTLHVLISATRDEGKHNITDLVDLINRMFGDLRDGERPRCITLCTSHRSKGREWKRVFILGRDRYMPSPYAKKPEQLEQERNLEYVSITRAMYELIDVEVPPPPKRDEYGEVIDPSVSAPGPRRKRTYKPRKRA